MAKNTIGQFIAALRKANGMTQQELADKLNVSNKAVSRWERDECAPDISLIPVIAEIFGVTCDELLKGERIIQAEATDKKEQRVEKQVKLLINRTLSSFKTLIWISLAVSVVGLILMFGISYGFYRPIIGFTVMLLFEICALVLTIAAITRAKDAKRDNEIFETADDNILNSFNGTLGSLSFYALFAALSSVLLSVPLILFNEGIYIDSALSAHSYFTLFFGIIALGLALVFIKCKIPYIQWITEGRITKSEICAVRAPMNFVQLGAVAAAWAVLILAPFFDKAHSDIPICYIAANVLALCLLTVSIVCFFVVFVKKREYRKHLLISGIRNIVLIPSAIIIYNFHSVGWSFEPYHDNSPTAYVRYEWWEPEYLLYAVLYCMAVFLVFSIMEAIAEKLKKS